VLDPFIILAPARSFTSLACQMIGQHPQMYGLPELNLFVAETIREREGVLATRRLASDGLLRAIAQLVAGEQTVQTIAFAKRWLLARGDQASSSVFRELQACAAPRILVDKSPRTVLQTDYLERMRRAFPRAGYLHLLRHPRNQSESLWRVAGPLAAWRQEAYDYTTNPPRPDLQQAWYRVNVNILMFLDGVPSRQKMRIRGEDLLANPDSHLESIAGWVGVRTDREAISEMKHPERSPFSCLGPPNAPSGNDLDFLQRPELRPPGPRPEASLEGPLPWRPDGLRPEVKELAREFGYA
jgi:hypothetical protein